jgi:hypothetical protein
VDVDRRAVSVVRAARYPQGPSGLDQSLAADEVLFALVLDVAAARVAVVRLERIEDLPDAQSRGRSALGIDRDLPRLELAAEGVDLDDPRHGPELGDDDPVEDLCAAPWGCNSFVCRAPGAHGLAA